MTDADDIAAKRARLAALESELAWLKDQYDLAMSAFKFDEARELHAGIEATERERLALADGLPPPPSPTPPAKPAPRRRPLPLRRRRRR